MKQVTIFAHRGASGTCPENTMASFRTAIELGATGIETDVQMTRDGHLVLIHDESTKRTTGHPALVKDLTLEEIRQLDAGSWFDSAFTGERIPLLEELLELAKGTDLVLNIELKTGIVIYPDIERRLTETIRQYGLQKQVIISSFNHYSLAACKQHAPEIRTAILYMEGLYEPWNYAKGIGADALHPAKHAVIPEWVEEAAKNGVAYHPWTANTEEEMKLLVDAGVAGIITDYPDKLKNVLQAAGRISL